MSPRLKSPNCFRILRQVFHCPKGKDEKPIFNRKHQTAQLNTINDFQVPGPGRIRPIGLDIQLLQSDPGYFALEILPLMYVSPA